MIVCAGNIEMIKGANPIGVGLIASALNLSQMVKDKAPEEIIFIGSAGSYGRYKPFDIVHSCVATRIEVSNILGYSYTPIEDVEITNVSCETNIVVNSSNYITTNKEVAQLFLEKGIDLENMEFYSVLYIAKKYKINARGVFVVTNYCDENAHGDFRKNLPKAKEIMEDIIAKS